MPYHIDIETLRQIAQNAGVDGSIVISKVKEGTGSFGFNAASLEYVDLVKAGIVDPAKVVRIALENAVSVSSILLLTEATMTEKPEKKESHGAPPPELG